MNWSLVAGLTIGAVVAGAACAAYVYWVFKDMFR